MITKERVIETLKTCNDPELGIDVWTLGLIYAVALGKDKAKITMTFTTPLCPYGPMLVEEIRSRVMGCGAKEVAVEVVFTPPWKPSEDVKEMLGMS